MGVVRPTMEYFPLAWMFFVPFIIVTSFAVLNLFIGIIVDAMQVMHELPSQLSGETISKKDFDQLIQRLDNLQQDINHLSERVTHK